MERRYTHTHTHTHAENHKKNEILPFAKTWMDVEKIMVSEIIIAISPEALQKQPLSWAHTFWVTM